MTMRRISVERTSVTYQVQNAESDPVHLWCNLNVSEFACVFMLPGEHAERYEQVYGATLAGFARLGLEVTWSALIYSNPSKGEVRTEVAGRREEPSAQRA